MWSFLGGLVFAAAGLTGPVGAVAADGWQSARVTTRSIERFAVNPVEGSRLAFEGGLVLSGPRPLGGVSGLLVEGDRMLAVTDSGNFVAARLLFEGGRLSGLADVALGARLDRDGNAITTKSVGDGEALARGEGEIYVLQETLRQLLAYPADGLAIDLRATPREIPLSAEERRIGRSGLEALATRPDGSLVMIAEARDGDAKTAGAAVVGGRRFQVARRDGFAITGADILPGGDMVIVERRWRGGLDVSMRVRRIGADAVASGGLVDGPILLEAGFSAEIDNMEAIAAEVEDGTIHLLLASDDNHSFLQRTLILRFAIADPLPRPRPSPPARG